MSSAFMLGLSVGFVFGRLIMRFLVAVVAMVALAGCAAQREGLEALEAATAASLTEAEVVNDDLKEEVRLAALELERKNLLLLDKDTAAKWDAASTDGMIAVADAKGIAAAAVAERDAIRKAAQEKIERFNHHPAMERLRELNQIVRDHFVREGRLIRTLEEIGRIVKPKAAPTTPTEPAAETEKSP